MKCDLVKSFKQISGSDDTNLCYIDILNSEFTTIKSTSHIEAVRGPADDPQTKIADPFLLFDHQIQVSLWQVP